MGFCEVLLGDGKSSSKVTHCLAGFTTGAGGWCRGTRIGGREEGNATGKAGAGDGSGVRGNKGAGSGLRLDESPNRDTVLWNWVVGAAAGAAV